jgi:hypothetical protein
MIKGENFKIRHEEQLSFQSSLHPNGHKLKSGHVVYRKSMRSSIRKLLVYGKQAKFEGDIVISSIWGHLL